MSKRGHILNCFIICFILLIIGMIFLIEDERKYNQDETNVTAATTLNSYLMCYDSTTPYGGNSTRGGNISNWFSGFLGIWAECSEGAKSAHAWSTDDEASVMLNKLESGYSFIGWYTDLSCTKVLNCSDFPSHNKNGVVETGHFKTADYPVVYCKVAQTVDVTVRTNNSSWGKISARNSGFTNSVAFSDYYGNYIEQLAVEPSPGYYIDYWSNGHDVLYGIPYSMRIYSSYITAYFAPSIYTINLDKQSGSDGSSTIYLKYNAGWYSNSVGTTSISTITKPTRTGYTFQGYCTGTNGSGTQIIDSTGKIVGSQTYTTNNTTLYANWTANTYKVTLDRQGATNGSSPVTATYNSAMPSITVPTKTGYTFQGYYTGTSGGGTKYYNSNGTSARNYDMAYETTLYAYWTPISYSINFNLGNGSWSGSSPTNNTQYDKAINVPAPRPPTGYTFAGWTSGTNFNSSTAQSGTSSSSTTSWSGSLTKNTYFKNLTASDGVTVTLVANYTANSYTVRFNPNGGTVSQTTKSVTYDSTYGDLPTPTRTGYNFTGWTLNGTKITSTTQVKTASNHTLVAQWQAISYTLTFDPNGQGGAVSPTTKTVTYDSTYGDLPIPTRAGYIFIGWYTSDNGGSQVLSNTTVKTADKHVLYAHWQDTWATQAKEPREVTKIIEGQEKPVKLIENAQNLAWLAMQAQTKNLSGFYEQTTNIDLKGNIWLPIGTDKYYFGGYYDGKGYIITGLTTAETIEGVSNSSSVNSYVGLFGNTNGAKLNNIYVKEAVVTGHTNVGGIVGYAKGSTVLTGCGFSGTISATANSGALIGNSASTTVQIKDCIVFSANVDKLNSGSATTTSTIYVLNGEKGYIGSSFTNWVYVSGMPYPVPKGLSWLANGGSPASKTDIENWANS